MPRPNYPSFLDHVRRFHGDSGRLTVDDLLSSLRTAKYDYDRNHIVAMLKQAASQGLGSFCVGRRGHKSRISWQHKPQSWAEAITSTSNSAQGRMVHHEFPLRPGRAAKLDLPDDLTLTEVERLTAFLRLLAGAEGEPSGRPA